MFILRSGAICLFLAFSAAAQGGEFFEDFEGSELVIDPTGRDGWAFMTGDGDATMNFSQAGGTGRVEVDARADRHNIWWAFIRHSVSADIDGDALAEPENELRVEARIRVSHAPRRVNLHVNHSRTTDYHSHLMEFDIPGTEDWHVISFTTSGFDALPHDEVFVQMALMDWGKDRFTVEVDYLKVKVVDPLVSGSDQGEPLPYRPSVPPLDSFSNVLVPAADGVVDLDYPNTSAHIWVNRSDPDVRTVLAAGGTLMTLLRWELEELEACRPSGWGVLELKMEHVYRADTGPEELGELRVVEILGGNPHWQGNTVSLESFLAGETIESVLNGQMIIDVPPASARGATTLITISPPVLRRLQSGRTKGLAIYSQGSVQASFDRRPKLYFNVERPKTGCGEYKQ